MALANAISNFEQKFLMERIYHFDGNIFDALSFSLTCFSFSFSFLLSMIELSLVNNVLDLSGHDQRTTGMKNSVLDYRESILYNIEKVLHFDYHYLNYCQIYLHI